MQKSEAPTMNELYENIARLCQESGTSVSALCESAGVSPGILSDLKNGRKKNISSETLAKLAKALGVSTDSLLGIAADPLEDEFLAFYGQVARRLTENDRRELMALVRLKAEMTKGHDQK